MPYLDKDFKPTLFEYTNVNDYNRLLVYYPRKGGRRVSGQDCDFTYELLVTPTPTPTISVTLTPSLTPSISITPTATTTPTPTPSVETYHIEAQNGDLIITQGGDNLDWFPL